VNNSQSFRIPANSARPKNAGRSARIACGSSLLRDFVLCDNSFEPRDILQQALAG
jgi:hypothetical protein